jgi:type IV pilus assembly protein PilM
MIEIQDPLIMQPIMQKYFSAIKKIIPEKEKRPFVGLDIGSYSCKAVELKKEGTTFQLTGWGVELVQNGDKKKAIRDLLARMSSIPDSPVTAVSSKGTLIRYIEMPRMALLDLKKSFALEADKYFPFPIEQIYTDCFILDPNSKDNKMHVLVAAAKKEIVDDRIALLGDLGIHSDFITLNPIAVANVSQFLGVPGNSREKPGSEDNAAVILDIGESVTNLTIVCKGLPKFTRDIFIGGRDFTKALCNTLGVSLNDAQTLKQKPGQRSPEVLQACESIIVNLVSELRLSFDYFMTENNIAITQILLTGGVSSLIGIDEAFAKNCDLPVVRWNPFEFIEKAESLADKNIEPHAAELTVALGLALSCL